MALNLFKDWVFLIEPGRSFHGLGAAAWKDRSPSVVSVLPLKEPGVSRHLNVNHIFRCL